MASTAALSTNASLRRVVFLGTGEIGVASLRSLAALNDWQVCGVFTQPDRPAGRDLRLRPSAIKTEALALGLPVFQPERIRSPEGLAALSALQPGLLVVIAYGQILPRSILDLPPLGCLNVHASLLPRHRGASPIQAAILAGDSVTGVTIMWMDEGLDTGAELLRREIALSRHETGGSLHDRLAAIAPAALLSALSLIEGGHAPRIPQQNSLATYAPKLTRESGRIDWSASAWEIDQRIRAFSPWPGSSTTVSLGDSLVPLKVHRAALLKNHPAAPGRVLRADRRGILVGTGQGAILLLEIQAAGGRRLSAAEFLRGRPIAPGTMLGVSG